MNLTGTFTIIPSREHPSRLDPNCSAVWSGSDRDPSRRFLPSVYRVSGGYLLSWSGPGWGADKMFSVLELFDTEAEAINSWRNVISKEAV